MWLRVIAAPPLGESVVKSPPRRIFPFCWMTTTRTNPFAFGSNSSSADCPRTATAAKTNSTMPRWFEIPEEQFNELLRLARMYRREAKRCMGSKAYLAGCICAASALEAMLTAMLHMYGDEIEGETLRKWQTNGNDLISTLVKRRFTKMVHASSMWNVQNSQVCSRFQASALSA